MPNEIRMIVTAANKAKQPLTDAKKDVKELAAEVKKIPDNKTVRVEIRDNVTRVVDRIKKDTIPDKEIDVKANDDATPQIEKIAKQQPPAIRIPVKADGGDRISQGFDDVGKSSASAFIGGFSGGLAGGGLADIAANVIGGAFDKINEKAKLAADVQNMMGISPDQARQYGDRIGHMFWSGIGESKDQIAGAFGSLSSDVRKWGDLTVDAQDRIVKKAVAVGSAFKVDIQEPIKAASSMVDNGLVPSYDNAFDIITRGYQTLGSRADDTLDTLGEYSGYFDRLGFSGEQALSLISQGLQNGARDTDFIADAWKEFGIRIVDNTELTKTALKDLGLNAKKIPEIIAEGGPRSVEAINQIIEKLKGIKDPIKKNEIGVALFGTQWEDTFRRVIDNTTIGIGKVDEFKGATEGLSTGAVTELDKLGRKWDEFISGVGEGAATLINHSDAIKSSQDAAIAGLFDFSDSSYAARDAAYAFGVSLDGTNRGFEALADTVGGYAAPAFVQMIGRMNDSQLAALGVTRKLDELGRTVLTLPNGKTIVIDTNAGRVVSDLSGVRSAVNSLPTQKFFTYYMDTVVRGPGPGVANLPMPFRNAAGGAVVGHAADGGARNGLTLVNEQGPELGRMQNGELRDLQSGMTVIEAGRSAQLAAAANAGRAGGGEPITINLMLDGRVLETVVVDRIRNAVAGRAGGSVSKFFNGRP